MSAATLLAMGRSLAQSSRHPQCAPRLQSIGESLQACTRRPGATRHAAGRRVYSRLASSACLREAPMGRAKQMAHAVRNQRGAWQALQQSSWWSDAAAARRTLSGWRRALVLAKPRPDPANGASSPLALARAFFRAPPNFFTERSGIGMPSMRLSSWQPETVVYAIMGVNFVVFGMWQIRCMQGIMNAHFVTSYQHMRHGYLHTLLTTSVSQQGLSHLFTNMFTFYFFGTNLVQVLGSIRVRTFTPSTHPLHPNAASALCGESV